MLKKIFKNIITILIILTFVIHFSSTIVYASIVDSARGESGPEPPPATPPDDSTSQPTNKNNNIRIIYNKIEGNVYEDLGTTFLKPNEKESNHKLQPIFGVIVNLFDSRNNIVKRTTTKADGSYTFTNLKDGTYHTEFWYGDITGSSSNEDIKNRIKYNGHDYIAVKTPAQKTYLDSIGTEIRNSGEGAIQVYLAIDCSYSMRYEFFESTRKLDYIVDAAEDLCQSLLDLNDNIYIGLIFFSGTNYRAVSLTKNINNLNDALEDIKSNNWYTPNTDILGALSKAQKSFYGKNNRYLILLSDGIPTSDGKTMVYNTDNNSTIMNKLNTISETTKKQLKKLKDDGITNICLFTATDEDEITIINKVFKNNSNEFGIFNNINITVKTIKETLHNYIKSKADSKAKEYTTSHNVLAGYEDPNRRKEVDNMFASYENKLDYNNTIMFDQIENYNNFNTAKKLSDATKMLVKGGSNYIIKNTLPEKIEIKDSDGNVIKTIEYQFGTYTGDLWLAKRPQFQLSTKITATHSKIILPDMFVTAEESRKVGAGMNDFILHYVEPEIFYGSTLELEYTIAIHNNSPFQSDYAEVLVQIPKEFELKSCSYPYEKVNTQELLNNNLITSDINSEKETFKITLDNKGQGKNGFYIPPGGSHNIAVTISRITSGFSDESIDNIEPISAEILKYSNGANRRMTFNTTSTKMLGVYPGNGTEVDFANTLTNSKIIIIPPTGASLNHIAIIAVIALLAIIIVLLIYKHLKKN
ncbi:MAG: VWA domain-containing protein [Clostridia bacterium]|nr:VWA domain-containing protein [Clostridia bacterium]